MTYVCAEPWAFTTGPRDAKLVLVAEAHGEQEDLAGTTLCGPAGQLLDQLLRRAGLQRRDCLATNVFAFRPLNNNLDNISGPKKDAPPGILPFRAGKYLRGEFLPELDRLWTELLAYPRNLVIALGGTASWALLDNPRITSCRGYLAKAKRGELKVLPTFHPSYCLRDPSTQPIVVADLLKAKAEAQTATISVRPRRLLVYPTLAEMAEWFCRPALWWAVDIETRAKQITDIGFARTIDDAMVVTFIDPDGRSTWANAEDESLAWRQVQVALESPREKIFQNGLYDLQYLSRMGFRPRGCHHDTMLLHHAMFPEQRKGLEFLGSLYSSAGAWKPMRKLTPTKRDE